MSYDPKGEKPQAKDQRSISLINTKYKTISSVVDG